MNTYGVKAESGKVYGPFKNAAKAASWAINNLRGTWGHPSNWTIVRIFKP